MRSLGGAASYFTRALAASGTSPPSSPTHASPPHATSPHATSLLVEQPEEQPAVEALGEVEEEAAEEAEEAIEAVEAVGAVEAVEAVEGGAGRPPRAGGAAHVGAAAVVVHEASEATLAPDQGEARTCE